MCMFDLFDGIVVPVRKGKPKENIFVVVEMSMGKAIFGMEFEVNVDRACEVQFGIRQSQGNGNGCSYVPNAEFPPMLEVGQIDVSSVCVELLRMRISFGCCGWMC